MANIDIPYDPSAILGAFPATPVLAQAPVFGQYVAPVFGQRQFAQPLDPNLQRNLKTLQNKWAAVGAPLSSLGSAPDGSNIAATIMDMDRQRIMRGQAPLSKPQTAAVAKAIQGNKLSTPGKERGLLNVPGNALRDLANIVTSIPRIPGALIEEAQQAPKGLTQAASALGRGDLAGALEAPGVRMLPGAYVGANLARGDVRELVQHPLMTALDVVPAAGKLNELTGGALSKAARESRVGRAASVAVDELGVTRPGQLAKRMFGADTRELTARPINLADATLRNIMNPDVAMPTLNFGDAAKNAYAQQVAELSRRTSKLAGEYDEAMQVSATEKAVRGAWDEMTPDETIYVTQLDEISRTHAELRSAYSGEILEVNIPKPDGTPGIEWLPASQAKRIYGVRDTASRARKFADLRTTITDATRLEAATPESLVQTVRDIATAPKIQKGRRVEGAVADITRRAQLDMAITALDMKGFDTLPVRRALNKLKGDARYTEIAKMLDGLEQKPLIPAEQMLATVDRYGRQWTRAGELRQAIKSGDWRSARQLSKSILGNKKATIPELADFIDSIDRYLARDRTLSRTSTFTERAATKAEQARLATERATVPARFRDVLVERTVGKLADDIADPTTKLGGRAAMEREFADIADDGDTLVASRVDPANRDAIVQAIMEERYADAGITREDFLDYRDGIAKTWQDIRDIEGVEPVFLHRVTEGGARAVRYPHISEIAMKPSSVKESVVDISPHVPNLAIGVTHQGLEYIAQMASENFVRELQDSAGVTRAALETRYADEARAMTDHNPGTTYQDNLQRIIKKRYTPFNPNDLGFNWDSQALRKVAQDGMFIPRHLADAIKDFHPPKSTRLSAAWDPVMKVYRTALLPLSPRWHVNNVVGGLLMTLGRTDPTVLRDIFNVRRMMKDGTLPEHIQQVINATGGQEAAYMRELSFMSGKTQGRIMRQLLEAPGNKFVAAVGERLGKSVEWSYALNQHVDNMYRAAALMYGERNALRRASKSGRIIPVEEARMAGLELMHKIMPEWAAMTGLERTIMRQMFPFYAFVGHMMRYVMKYPADHPVRASIMGGITRAELQDLGDGLPEQWLSIFRFGRPNAQGEQKGFAVGALNPFTDVADSFTVLGWASQMNPVLSTIAEQLGLEDGQREAYPTLQWDPIQGRLVAKQPNIISSFAFNTVPQAELLSMFAGASTDFREFMRENPEQAMRRVYALTGIPVGAYRTVNANQSLAKNQLAVLEDQRVAMSKALKSGDQQPALAYPELRAKLEQLNGLSPEQLAPYRLDPDQLQATTDQILAALGPGGSGPQAGVALQQARAQRQAVSVRRAHAGGI